MVPDDMVRIGIVDQEAACTADTPTTYITCRSSMETRIPSGAASAVAFRIVRCAEPDQEWAILKVRGNCTPASRSRSMLTKRDSG